MKNNFYTTVVLSLLLISCGGKKEKKNEQAISAISIIKGQVNHLDTSLYQIMKYDMQNGRTDTSYLKREDVRSLAADFLSLPDISIKDYEKNYTEERLFDAQQNSFSITATAKNEKMEIQKQIIIVPLDETAAGNVHSIYIDRLVQLKDSSIEQKLFWQIDKYFQIGNIIQVGNQPEKTKTLKVTWE